MLELHPSTQLKHVKQMKKFLKAGRFVAFNNFAKEHHRLVQIGNPITLADMNISELDKENANKKLRAICILSDIVDGAATDLLSIIEKYDKYVEVPICLLCEHLKYTAEEIRKIVNDVGDKDYSISFGDVVDNAEPLILDTINELFNERRI